MQNRTVFCMGVFDLCHLGHINFFAHAKAQGDYLVVGLIQDEAVKMKKGKDRPIMNWNERYAYLSSIKYIDCILPVRIFSSNEILRLVKPDIYYKGNDQTHINDDYAKEINIPIIYSNRPDDGWSTTQLIAKIKGL